MKKILLILLILISNNISAQIEELYYPDESCTQFNDDFDQLNDLISDPVSLISGNIERLLIIPGINSHDLARLNEITSDINVENENDIIKAGFALDKLKLIIPYITFKADSKSSFMIRSENAWRDSQFYSNRIRCRLKSEKLDAGFVIDRDPDEKFDDMFYSYFLQRKLKNFFIILGNYRINWGSGILHAPEYSRYFSRSAVNTITRFRQLIRPYTSSSETGYFQGSAVQFEKNSFRLNCWLSKLNVTHPQKLYGTAISFNNTWINSGICMERTIEDSSTAYLPQRNVTDSFSLFAAAGFRKIALKTEFARSAGCNGVVSNLEFGINKIKQVLVYRSYQSGFNRLYGNPVSRTSNFAGENGLYYGIAWKIRPKLILDFYADIWNNSTTSEDMSIANFSKEEMLNINFTKNKLEILSYLKHREKQDEFSVSDSVELATVNLITAKLSFRYNFHKLQIRSDLNFRNEIIKKLNSNENAFAFFQQFNWKPGKLQIWYRFTAFKANIPIYLYENNIRGLATTVCFSDEGIRNAIKLKYKIKNYSAELKAYYQNSQIDKKGINFLITAKF